MYELFGFNYYKVKIKSINNYVKKILVKLAVSIHKPKLIQIK